MRILFVHYLFEDRGSAQDFYGLTRIAPSLGHEVCLYGPPRDSSPFEWTMDVRSADALVFVFEWTTDLKEGDRFDWTRLVASVPRHRRVVIDCDGRYNDPITVVGDQNHDSEQSGRAWVCLLYTSDAADE